MARNEPERSSPSDLSEQDSRFLLMATAAGPAAELANAASRVTDWPALMVMARHHGIFSLLAEALLALPDGLIPAEVSQIFRDQGKRQTMVMMKIVGELARLSTALGDVGVPVIALKGPALAVDLYGGPMKRDRGDLDLLIPHDCLLAADRVLQDAGYRRMGPVALESNTTFLSVLQQASNDLEYRHPDKSARLELHWRWHRNPHALKFDAAALWGGVRQVQVAMASLRVPARAELWLYLASHGGRHRWFRLKWITDIRRALADEAFVAALPDAVELSRHRGGGRALAVAVLLAERLDERAGIEREAEIPAVLRQDQVAQTLADRFEQELFPNGRLVVPSTSLWREINAEWRLTPSFRDKMALVAHRVFAPTERDAETLALPRGWHGLYPLVRPGLWLRRQLRR